MVDAQGGQDGSETGVGNPVQIGVVAQVLAPAQLPVEERFMAEVAHLSRQSPPLVRQRRAEHARAPAVRAQEPREHTQQGGLPGAVAAEDGQRLALLHAHAHAAERDPLAVPPLEALELDRSHAPKPMLRLWREWSASTTLRWRSATWTRPSRSTGASSTSSCAGACTGWAASTWAIRSALPPRATARWPIAAA